VAPGVFEQTFTAYEYAPPRVAEDTGVDSTNR
jgi:hypothetical protein